MQSRRKLPWKLSTIGAFPCRLVSSRSLRFLLLPHCVISFPLGFSVFHFRCQCASLFIIPGSSLKWMPPPPPPPSTGFKAFDILSKRKKNQLSFSSTLSRCCCISIWCAHKNGELILHIPPSILLYIFFDVFSFCFISISFDFVWLFKWKIVTIIFELIE